MVSQGDMFIFEMANNHQGDVQHGKLIIDMCSDLAKKHKITNPFIKFQFRDLDTFIHEDKREKDIPYVKRFLSTELKTSEFKELANYAKAKGLGTVGTVFDEKSIETFLELGIDILKIASCSIDDFPLLHELGKVEKPTVLSTGGTSNQTIIRALNTLKKKNSELAILHCVGIYPTTEDELLLQNIGDLKKLFGEHKIGFSTHESPSNDLPIAMALSLGATIFEKHVAVERGEIKKNAYSADKNELDLWLANYNRAKAILNCESEHFEKIRSKENIGLNKLKRGVFHKEDRRFFAFPKDEEGQDVSSLYYDQISKENEPFVEAFDSASLILRKAGYKPSLFETVDFSFHHGMEKFTQFGAVYFKQFENDFFLKKLIVMKKGQELPLHKHRDRTELLHVKFGEARIEGSQNFEISKEDFLTFTKDEIHSFFAKTDLVLEEVVAKESKLLNESEYEDKKILKESARKKSFSLKNGFLVW